MTTSIGCKQPAHAAASCDCTGLGRYGTRRAFLQAMGALGAAAALPACTSMETAGGPPKLNGSVVAPLLLGGGPAGIGGCDAV